MENGSSDEISLRARRPLSLGNNSSEGKSALESRSATFGHSVHLTGAMAMLKRF